MARQAKDDANRFPSVGTVIHHKRRIEAHDALGGLARCDVSLIVTDDGTETAWITNLEGRGGAPVNRVMREAMAYADSIAPETIIEVEEGADPRLLRIYERAGFRVTRRILNRYRR